MSDANDPVASFTAHPRTFMRTNIIVVGGITAEQVTGQIFTTPQEIYMLGQSPKLRLGLVELNGEQIDNKPGGKVYGLYVCSSPSQKGFEAFFCPYKQDKAFFVQLSSSARFMFTATMDGCTFGVGSQSGGGSANVGHVNFGKVALDWGPEQGPGRQIGAQLNVVDDRLGANSLKIQPPDYRGPQGDTCSTTVGRLGSDGMWHFYTLRYRKSGARRHYHVGLVGEGV